MLFRSIKTFSLERCSKSGAKFDYEKGKWFNHQYIQLQSNAELATLFLPVLAEKGVEAPFEMVEQVIALTKERVSFVKELWDQSSFFFVAPTSYDEKMVKKRWKENSAALLAELATLLEGIDDFTAARTEGDIKVWIEAKAYNLGGIMTAFRLALVGEGKGPYIFDIIAVIGKEETLARIQRAIDVLK